LLKAEGQWEWQQLAEEQAEKDWLAVVMEKAKDQLEQLAELEQMNHEVSPDVSIWHSVLMTWSGSCEDTGHGGARGWAF